ncbi:MAG: glycosyltransferase family 1 protein [Gemmatimonadales bacterium]|nr:glycosyltransferase family 1 protein [Gemmatimonadales bacterium]
MRIAIFSEVYWPMVSGVSHSLQRLVAALEARGHTCRIYAPEYALPAGTPDLATVHRSPALKLFLYPDVQWGFPRQAEIAADFAAFAPDVVHVATEFAMGTTGLRLARQFGVPVVASAHTDYERYASRYRLDWLMPAGWGYLRWFYAQASMVLCPSRVYERHLNLRGVRHTGIWTRGVNREQFSPARRRDDFASRLGLAPGTPIVLYVGRLAAEKNLTLLLDAWSGLVARGTSAELVLVGRGPLGDVIASARHPQVTLAGMLTGEPLWQAYASADLFAFPSSTETFGNVLLEAMASGLPSLAAAAGGVLDFAVHGENAWLVEPDSVPALVEGLDLLLRDAPRRTRLSRGALDTAAGRDWEAIFDGVVAAYREAIGATQPVLRAA